MAAMSTQERVALHRLKREAANFLTEWLDGNETATPQAFLVAKMKEFGSLHDVELLGFAPDWVDRFREQVGEGERDVLDLLAAWKRARKPE